jgi:hypothetical protein
MKLCNIIRNILLLVDSAFSLDSSWWGQCDSCELVLSRCGGVCGLRHLNVGQGFLVGLIGLFALKLLLLAWEEQAWLY